MRERSAGNPHFSTASLLGTSSPDFGGAVLAVPDMAVNTYMSDEGITDPESHRLN